MCLRVERVGVLALWRAFLMVRHVVGDHHVDQMVQFRLLPSAVQLRVHLQATRVFVVLIPALPQER